MIIWVKNMRNIEKCTLLFTIGGIGYGLLEILWRRRTHISMILAGGICFVIFDVITRRCKGAGRLGKAGIAALVITLIELIFGVIFNLLLGLSVWDYSSLPFNFLGQICPLYCGLWFLLSIVILPFEEFISDWLSTLGRKADTA